MLRKIGQQWTALEFMVNSQEVQEGIIFIVNYLKPLEESRGFFIYDSHWCNKQIGAINKLRPKRPKRNFKAK